MICTPHCTKYPTIIFISFVITHMRIGRWCRFFLLQGGFLVHLIEIAPLYEKEKHEDLL